MSLRSPRLPADDCRRPHALRRGAPKRAPDVGAGQPCGEKASGEGVARASRVDHLTVRTVERKAAYDLAEKSRDARVAYAADVDRLIPRLLDSPTAAAFQG